MYYNFIIFLFALTLVSPKPQPAGADEIVMRNGERFTVSAVWEEDDKIRFDMQGLVVSVDKMEVAAVIRSENNALEPSSTDIRPMPHRPASDPIEKPKPQADNSEAPERSAPRRNAPPQPRESVKDNPSPKTLLGQGKGKELEDIVWGMSPNSLPGLEKLRTEAVFGGIDQYWRPEKPLIFGIAPLDGWVFGFWKDQLYTIVMWTDGRIGYDRMKNEVFSRYGPGTRSKSHDGRYIWIAEDTQHMLEFDTTLNTGLFVMRSSQMDARIKQLYP